MTARIVMVVDDEAELRELIAELLSSEGYEVRTARHGADALRQLRRGDLPDLILLDLTMPVMDGVTFRRTQLRDPLLSAIPVVVASAIVPVEDLPTTRQLSKPFGVDDLLQVVSQELGDESATVRHLQHAAAAA